MCDASGAEDGAIASQKPKKEREIEQIGVITLFI